ncbi:MFS transporter [Pollutimonas harenae]|uniref:MFS transporter n=1 Tax=Pollutimonas harenae TaxID=657015 RepID=A0A853H172_9BURK|nr:MFS transporter [Pollutimonas harenae]NYT86716.1 MFS transporter [Pollutimonas harenae]TEA71367.1 MFS transporter [Pollutimonas harenae]
MKNAAEGLSGKPSSTLMAGLALALAFLFNVLGRGIGDTYMVFLLPLNAEFGWNRSELSSVYSIYMLSTGLSAPFVGMLFDRWGPRVVYATGLTCLGIAYVLAGNLTQLWQFQLCVGIAGGIGVSALGMVPAAGLISRWYRGNTGTALGIAYSGVGCGTLLIVPLAQYLNESMGWRSAYHILGVGLLVLLPIILFLPWRTLRAGIRPDAVPDRSTSTLREPGKPQVSPLRTALKTRAFWELAQVFGFTGLAMYVILVQTVAFLIEMGFAPLQAAGAFGIAGMLSVIGVSASGALADRIGYRRTVTASFVSTFIGLLFLLAMTYQSSAWLLFGYIAMFGIAQGARGPIVSSLCAKIFPGRGLGTIYGTIYACMSIGAALGSLVSGVLHDITGGYQASFYFSMISLLLAIAPFWTSATLKRFGRS